jgi:hypothetical protein
VMPRVQAAVGRVHRVRARRSRRSPLRRRSRSPGRRSDDDPHPLARPRRASRRPGTAA